jgi:phospholipid transport system substrate-binding protein
MRMNRLAIVAFMASIAVFAHLGALAADPPATPEEVIRSSGDQMVKTVVERRSELESQPELIYQLVDEILLPHMDFEAMAQLALGPVWREATPEQRREFTAEFRNLLVRTYSTAWLAYDNQTIEYLPARPASRPDRATVTVRLLESGGQRTILAYSLRLKDGVWKVYDLSLDGVSLLTNYRSEFPARVRAVGLDGLIVEMRGMSRDAVDG